MSARSFRSVFMVASCAGAALGCYLVSLRVASERAALQEVENRIVMAEQDIRLLQTEIGTRGRLAQLERWNVRVLALSAPSADQFVDGGFALARLIKPERNIAIDAPVMLASAPAEAASSLPEGATETIESGVPATASELMHVASLKLPARQQIARADERSGEARQRAGKSEESKPTKSPEPRQAAEKKAGDKPARAADKPVTRPVRTAKIDPLAPLPASASRTGKDNDAAR